MEYRAEDKYIVTDAELALAEARISPVMERDSHQEGSCYEIRSLYFDDADDSGMAENEAGDDMRRKYRIRIYGNSDAFIRLEVKEKVRGFTKKISCGISRDEFEAILEGSMPFAPGERNALNLFMLQRRIADLRPKILVIYERSAFVYPAGNVRITFDRNILASGYTDSLFDENIPGLIPVMPEGRHILEVKYDEFLPRFIASQLETGRMQQTAFSKYYLSRLAEEGEFPIIK